MTFLLSLLLACPTTGPRSPADLPPLPPKLTVLAPSPGEARPFREALVALTGEVQGEIEPCGCPTTPYGGFARRQTLFDELRKVGPTLFSVDAGAMLVKGNTLLGADDRMVRARAVLDLAGSTGLDAWAAAPSDLVPGGVALLEQAGALSANWLAPDGTLALPASRLVERNGVTLGIIGLSSPVDGLGSRDPASSVGAAMHGDADAWIVLSNADDATNRAVAKVEGVGLVLATAGEVQSAPDGTHGAPIVETPARGRYVTLLHLSMGSTPRAFELVDSGVWKDLATARERGAPKSPEAAAGWAATLDRQRAAVEAASEGHNYVLVRSMPLASSLDGGSNQAAALVAEFRKASLQRAEVAAEAPGGPRYATAGACASCHRDRLAQWVFDPHASALDSLRTRQAEQNPECVSCHTTGFGRAGGFSGVEPREIEAYKGVQCEACHGPKGGHSSRGDLAAVAVTERTCRSCHDSANSPAFNYDTYLARISCSRVSLSSADDPATVSPIPRERREIPAPP